MQRDHIGMGELAHYGCLLNELHSVIIRGTWLQQLYGHLHLSPGALPESSVDCSKVTRAQVLPYPEGATTCDTTVSQYWMRINSECHSQHEYHLLTILACSYVLTCLIPFPTGHIYSSVPTVFGAFESL